MVKTTKKTTKPKPAELRKIWDQATKEMVPLSDILEITADSWDLDKLEAAAHKGIIQLQMLRARIISRG